MHTPTLDEHLQSIILNAESIRDSLTPHVLAMHEPALLAATKLADIAVEEIKIILESSDTREISDLVRQYPATG